MAKSGWNYPVQLETKTGKILKTDLVEDIRQSILILLSTTPGERVFHPNYGCNLQRFAFEPISYDLTRAIQSELYRVISSWEKRIYNLEIAVEPSVKTDNCLIFVIRYGVLELKIKDQLIYSYNMMGASI